MNAQLLIDAIVRQTTVLIAQLATTGGIRAPLAHLANQVFLDLARELETQGVSRKVSADMFGMAIRAYIRKVRRLSESSTEQGRSLWEAIYAAVRERNVVSRAELLVHFGSDDEELVRGVLHDLVESGLVFVTGAGSDAILRAASDDELGQMRQLGDDRSDELLWAMVFQSSPITYASLKKVDELRSADLDATLARLEAAGRIVREESPEGPRFRADSLVVPLGAELGWEAAVFDQYHAVVSTICRKLGRKRRATPDDSVGGSTYTFELWPGHPLEDRVKGALSRFRAEHTELRRLVLAHNQHHPAPASAYRAVVYGGQYLASEEEGDR
jgi:hypothetical protein